MTEYILSHLALHAILYLIIKDINSTVLFPEVKLRYCFS